MLCDRSCAGTTARSTCSTKRIHSHVLTCSSSILSKPLVGGVGGAEVCFVIIVMLSACPSQHAHNMKHCLGAHVFEFS